MAVGPALQTILGGDNKERGSMRRKHWILAIRVLAALVLGTVALIEPFEIWGAWTAPHEYPFGSEGPAAAMWTYDSQRNYLIASVALWTTSVLAFWALLAKSCRLRTRILCAAPFLMVWALMAYDGSRLTY